MRAPFAVCAIIYGTTAALATLYQAPFFMNSKTAPCSKADTGHDMNPVAKTSATDQPTKMITGVHAMFYSSDPEATRAFLRDALGLKANDVGGGWLIFPFPEAEVAVHPLEDGEPKPGTQEFSFYCDDIEATVADLQSGSGTVAGPIEDTGWGLVTRLAIPGGCSALLYQRKY